MDMLTIGQLAKRLNVNIQTIRYYERRKIMPKPKTRESGYRQYSDTDVARLQFIIHAKDIGFTLSEIADLLSMRVSSKTTCSDIRNLASLKVSDIETRIDKLHSLRKVLLKLIDMCNRQGLTGTCPILDVLENKQEIRRKKKP